MTEIKRAQFSTLLRRLREKPRRLQIVTGPRQTGKTTLVCQVLDEVDGPSRYVSTDEPDSARLPRFPGLVDTGHEFSEQSLEPCFGEKDTSWLVAQWELARERADESDRGFVLAIDEIQTIPNWSATVKGLWDADRRADRCLHVILLGSAPLIMQQGLSESLAGRFETIRLMHWSFAEMSKAFDFDLDHYIYFGGYPGGAKFASEQVRWHSYITEALIEPNIERDILALKRVDKPALLKQLFEIGTAYSGQIFSYNKLIGHLKDAGNTTTLTRYMDLLTNAGLMTGLTKYATKTHRRRASIPKLNVLNTALMTAASGYSFEEAKADRSFWGRLVESAAGAHLYNTGIPEHSLHYWREGNAEVDFVLKRGPRIVAFEVKSSTSSSIRNTLWLEQFKDRFNADKTVVAGAGGIPLSEFFSMPAQEWFESR